nr:hypothetical protein [Tanacetum cinerariifolium]
GPKAISNLFRGGKVTSGLSSLRLAEGGCDSGDEVEAASSLRAGCSSSSSSSASISISSSSSSSDDSSSSSPSFPPSAR